ncbi:MAG: ProQ/FINO family protein [Pseudomonadota bacterium]|nr:ProQ/FINO family protein [Pseudomonadota bacterium]
MTDTVSAPAPEFVPSSVPESAPASVPAPAPDSAAAPARPRRTQRGGSSRNRGRGQGDNKAGQDGQEGYEGASGAPRASAPRQNQQGAKPARAPRPVHPVLERLFALYPKMFGAHFLPLKLGVFQELLALHPDVFEKNELKVALGLHARSMRYLESVAAGHPRHNLQAEPVEPVAPEHVHHAIMEVFRRRQARTQEDLRPYARAQLIEAIEASGLSREDYLLCIRQQDEVSVALLDEAFAELGAQAAKRDALRKTFEASGKSVAEFADMYGMDPQEVSRTLERSRASQTAQAAQAVQAAQAAQTAQATEMTEAVQAVEDQAPADASDQKPQSLPETNPADAAVTTDPADSREAS